MIQTRRTRGFTLFEALPFAIAAEEALGNLHMAGRKDLVDVG